MARNFSNRHYFIANIFGNFKENDAIIQGIGKVSVSQESERKSGMSVKRDNEKSKQNGDASWHVAAVSISHLTKVHDTNRGSKVPLRFPRRPKATKIFSLNVAHR